jgi:hypothetical protein
MVMRAEGDDGVMNGGSRCRWPATRAATGCYAMRGQWWTPSSTRTAMEVDGGGA